ncbi:helix-turn-helix domain-containing protein [Bacillus toyonensis]|uniref:winged helix-turn-helix domain-containing protein n=1 Tax=Bacillus toyonensis TaxID=155322 RepID=UPI001443B8E2|nr:helix-turn-helix domain-containing protein [Bacillus toyonensis]NKW97323.1 winged helix-turn-helix domain-containing protein [Bacillus toyonensis]HDX9612660.1 winged helix-turn-helix domain-containing protein [Bacillus toyonensis]
MKIVVISPELFLPKLARRSAHYPNWEIIHVGDITSLNYILKDKRNHFDGIIWRLKSLDFEEVKEFRNIKKELENIPILILFDEDISTNKAGLELLKKNSTMSFEIHTHQQIQECVSHFYKHIVQLNRNKQHNNNIVELYPGIFMNVDMHYLDNAGEIFPLAGKEYEMLMFFINMREKFVTTEDILLAIWDEYTTTETVRQYIYKLRKKLYTSQKNFNLIVHRKGVGYTLIGKGNEFLVGL